MGSGALLIAIMILTVQSRKSNHNFSLRRVFIGWTLLATVIPFITLILVFRINVDWGIPDFAFMMSDTVIITVTGMMLSMSINILFARICPPGIEGVFMTILTSVVNIAYLVSGQISALLIKWHGIQCEEDPTDENEVICDFTNLYILIIVVNLTTLIPLCFIRKVPDEEQLKIIGDELKATTLDRDEEAVRKYSQREDLIGLYWWCENSVFPCCRRHICVCKYCQDEDGSEAAAIELGVSNGAIESLDDVDGME